jgi:hypothetical protein
MLFINRHINGKLATRLVTLKKKKKQLAWLGSWKMAFLPVNRLRYKLATGIMGLAQMAKALRPVYYSSTYY